VDLIPFMALPPGGQPGVVGFGICWSGAPGRAGAATAPVRRLGTAIVVDVAPMDCVAIQKSGGISDPCA